MQNIVKYCSFILLIASFQILQAKNVYKPEIADPVLEPWNWVEYEELDTLFISCLSKSNNGELWLGIGNNAVFHDGYRLNYYEVDSTSLISLAHEYSQNLLVATQKGIYRYADENFSLLLKTDFNGQHEFQQDKHGYIWIGSPHGLLKITPWYIRCFNQHGTFELAPDGTVTSVIASFTDLGRIVKKIQEIQFPLYKFFIDDEDVFWAACNHNGHSIVKIKNLQNIFTPSNWEFLEFNNVSGYGMSGICKYKNSLLISSGDPNKALQQIDLKTGKTSSVSFSHMGGDDTHSNMFSTSDGVIWIGGHSKIYKLDHKGWKLYQYPEVKLPLSTINLMLDRDDHLYLSGTGMFRKLEFANGSYQTYIGMNFHCNTPDNSYWFTSSEGMVVKADSSLTYFESYNTNDGLMDMPVLVYFSKKGELWAAGSHRSRAAVAVFDGEKWKRKRFPQLHYGISYDGVKEIGDTSIVFSSNGVLSFTQAQSGGFVEYKYKTKQWKTYRPPLVPSRIASVECTSDGRLWFSGGSLNVFDGDTTINMGSAFNSQNWTDDLVITSDTNMWVAQGGVGLFHFDGHEWKRYGVKDGLASNMVTNLLQENDQFLFIATDNGISCFDGKQFVSHVMHPSIGIAREKGTMKISEDQSVWINQGSREWFLYDLKNTKELPEEIFRTVRYHRDKNGPSTFITFAEKEIPPQGNVLIRFDGKDFMSKTADADLQFSYRLNNEKWSPFSDEKSALLLDLKDGDYTFEVRSRDRDLNIDQNPVKVSFEVQPPVHKRPWFILTILSFVATITYLLVRLYMRNKEIHELDQFKLRLFTDISHELKTPLTLIMLPLQKLLEKESKNKESRKYIELIDGNVQRLSNLVNQVIDFRRLESKTVQMEMAPTDIVQQIKSIFHYYKPLSEKKGIEFETEIGYDELWLNYDADKMEKIVVNLLSNAFKYTQDGGTVKFGMSWDEKTKKLGLLFSDNGPGIPIDLQKSIFTRFYRMKDSRLNKVPGSGIGLSLVKELVELQQGTIDVFSDGVNGTEFKVTIPLEKADRQLKPTPEIKIEETQERIEGKPLLLLVEDEEQMLQFVASELSKNFRVLKAVSAERGLEQLDTMPDLVISDVMLPGINGIEFCRRIKENSETSHVPVILLTARNSEEHIVEGISMGADDYITKPFKMNELRARSLGLIENRKRLRERFAENKQLKAEHFTSNKSDQQFLNKAIEIVFDNLDNAEFDVAMFCQKTGTSKTLLYSKLKTLTGQSATEFVRNIRLKEAQKILLSAENELTVAEISYKVGFNDPLYFSRCFKKYFGVPPSGVNKINK